MAISPGALPASSVPTISCFTRSLYLVQIHGWEIHTCSLSNNGCVPLSPGLNLAVSVATLWVGVSGPCGLLCALHGCRPEKTLRRGMDCTGDKEKDCLFVAHYGQYLFIRLKLNNNNEGRWTMCWSGGPGGNVKTLMTSLHPKPI